MHLFLHALCCNDVAHKDRSSRNLVNLNRLSIFKEVIESSSPALARNSEDNFCEEFIEKILMGEHFIQILGAISANFSRGTNGKKTIENRRLFQK